MRQLLPTALVAGVVVGIVHLVPYWHAAVATPTEWEFSGNIYASPDFMQYRVWPRQSAIEGAIVTNIFTTESNRAYLPVPFYWLVGDIARATGVRPEWIHASIGALLACLLAIVVIWITTRFLRVFHQAAWVVGAIFLGGGLGAYLKFGRALLNRLTTDGGVAASASAAPASPPAWLLAEDYRGHYVFATIFDTHYLVAWLGATLAVMALYRALIRPSAGRMGVAVACFAAATVLHVYEGVTLIAIAISVLTLVGLKGLLTRRELIIGIACIVAAGTALGLLLLLQRRSGLPIADWRALTIPIWILLIAHPLAWGLIAWGGRRYWRDAGLPEVFLLGWALGCTLLTLSGPLYPYPDRGTITLQIPIYVIAGIIFFRHWPRVTPPAAVVAIALLASSPLWITGTLWKMGSFSEDAPYKWTSPTEQATTTMLKVSASRSDILLADPAELRWIAPEYPGKHYVAHFFLTVDFDRKLAEWHRFCHETSAGDRLAFLRQHTIRFIHLPAVCVPIRTDAVPGLRLLNRDRFGSLFEVVQG